VSELLVAVEIVDLLEALIFMYQCERFSLIVGLVLYESLSDVICFFHFLEVLLDT